MHHSSHLDSICDAPEHGFHISPWVCSQCCWRALLLDCEELVLQQGEGDGEEELHLALMMALLQKPCCLQRRTDSLS